MALPVPAGMLAHAADDILIMEREEFKDEHGYSAFTRQYSLSADQGRNLPPLDIGHFQRQTTSPTLFRRQEC